MPRRITDWRENKMMKNYEAPSIEIVELSESDVITTSGFDGKDQEFEIY
jgi:hypothetical protein